MIVLLTYRYSENSSAKAALKFCQTAYNFKFLNIYVYETKIREENEKPKPCGMALPFSLTESTVNAVTAAGSLLL